MDVSFFATFASNVSRLKQVTDVAVATGRKLAVFGRSMEASFRTARELDISRLQMILLSMAVKLTNTLLRKSLFYVLVLRGTNGGTKSYRKWDSPPNLNSTW